MKALVVYVGQGSNENYEYGLSEGIWGFKPKKRPDGEFGPGDWIVFGRGFTGGSPRTTEDEWFRYSLSELAVAQISSGLAHEARPEWPDEKRSGIVTYSERIRFERPTRVRGPVALTDPRIPLDIAKALRKSAISNKGCSVLIDGPPFGERIAPPIREMGIAPSSGEPELIIDQLLEIENFIRSRGFNFETALLQKLYACIRAKPFLILAGNSGTGKSRLARLFSEAIGAHVGNGRFQMIPVRPDWSDSSELLGYFDLNGDFCPGQFVSILLMAEALPEKQFVACLDEMNLARVEHYFSDFLSIIESRRREHGEIITDPILREEQIRRMKRDSLSPFVATILDRLQSAPRPLGLPPNLSIIGTVNMDETTQPFSRKVLDRANTLEFNEIDLMEGVTDEVPQIPVPPLDIDSDFLRCEFICLKESLPNHRDIASEVATFLQGLNRSLAIAGFEVGYRVRDESIAFTIFALAAGMSIDAAKENIVLQKVLPRVQGSSPRIERALISLMQEMAGDENKPEPESVDFIERLVQFHIRDDTSPVMRKLAGMILIFREEGFTSFWLA